MEPQDINYLINKYSRTPNHKNTDDYYASNNSPRSSYSPFQDPNSKAYAAAMRALQERIRFLESENSELFQNFKNSELRLEEALHINSKLNEDLSILASNDQNANRSANQLKQELAQALREVKILQGQIAKMENNEFQTLSKENLRLKVDLDNAMRDISEYKGRELSQRLALERLEDAKVMLQEELSREKWKNREVEGENERFRESLNEAKHIEYEKEEVKRQNEQFLKAIQDLENKCRNYEETSESKSPKSSRGRLGNSSKKTVSFRKSGSKNRSKSRASKSTSPSSPRLSRPQNRHIGAHLVEYGDFGERVLRMESEMNQLQNKYRRLVSASKSETNGLERLKQDMGNLANELNSKSGILKKLKSEQILSRSTSRDFVTN